MILSKCINTILTRVHFLFMLFVFIFVSNTISILDDVRVVCMTEIRQMSLVEQKQAYPSRTLEFTRFLVGLVFVNLKFSVY